MRTINSSRRLIALVTFVLCAASSAWFSLIPNGGQLDYPIQVISVQRVLRGEAPYRDFQVLYGPLGYYIAAFFQWPLRFLAPATSANCFYYLCTLLYLAVVIRYTSRIPKTQPLLFLGSLLVIFLNTPTIAELAYYSLSFFLPLLFAVVTMGPALEETPVSSRKALYFQIASGCLVAVEFFDRINFGVYLLLALLIIVVLAWVLRRPNTALGAARCLAFAFAFACIIAIALAAKGILVPAIADTRLYILRASASRRLPIGQTDVFPLLLLSSFAVMAALLRIPRKVRNRQIDGNFIVYVLLCAFVSYALFRFDPSHVYPALALLLLLLTDPEPEPESQSPPPNHLVQWGQLASLLLLAVFPLFGMGMTTVRPILHYWHHAAFRPPLRNGVPVTTEQLEMLGRIDSLRSKSQSVYWAGIPGSCQTTLDMCVNLALYLADGTLPEPKIWFFDTASTPYEDVQETIIHDLEREKIQWIGMQGLQRTNHAAVPHPEAQLLQDYVVRNYVVVFTQQMPDVKYVIYSRTPSK